MTTPPPPAAPPTGPAEQLETATRTLSLVVSFLALALMLAGFLPVLAGYVTVAQGEAMLSPRGLANPAPLSWALWSMSLGILLLATLPVVRVGLTLVLFVSRRDGREVAVALLVLAELALSIMLK